jgi:peroxiredoxin (alkyl hydroperoxide reductase subunit C)
MSTNIIKAAIGKIAPSFKAIAVDQTPKRNFVETSLQDYKNKWLLLFFYPKDFTYICPTEIIDFSMKAKDFRSIGCEVLGCSTDT